MPGNRTTMTDTIGELTYAFDHLDGLVGKSVLAEVMDSATSASYAQVTSDACCREAISTDGTLLAVLCAAAFPRCCDGYGTRDEWF